MCLSGRLNARIKNQSRADRRLPICSFLCWNEIAKKIDIDKNVGKYDNIRNKLHKSDGKQYYKVRPKMKGDET